jgi:hypothetical protein
MTWRAVEVRDLLAGRLIAVHVVPVTPEGEPRAPHVLRADCNCGPRVEHVPGGVCPLIVHEMEQ